MEAPEAEAVSQFAGMRFCLFSSVARRIAYHVLALEDATFLEDAGLFSSLYGKALPGRSVILPYAFLQMESKGSGDLLKDPFRNRRVTGRSRLLYTVLHPSF